MASSTPHIHTFYRIQFTIIDPIVELLTIYMAFFLPDLGLEAMIPAELSSRDPLQDCMFHQLGALYAFMCIMHGGLLRYSSDLNVWNFVQFATLVVDSVILGSFFYSMGQQGRMEPARWRKEDWGCLGITVYVAVARTLFLMGVGVRKAALTKKKE